MGASRHAWTFDSPGTRSSGAPGATATYSSGTPVSRALWCVATKRHQFNNYTSPALKEQEEITASFFILIVIGFFGFLLFTMMISNIISSKRENYIDYVFSEKFNGQGKEEILPRKESQDTVVTICNKSALESEKHDNNNNIPEMPSTDTSFPNV
uniref:Potassium voltage-gated channel subfamily E member 1 n=1 Tax=Crocodylus porosus TaxID=8502 RepID=A0A7M4G0S4_CROPO